MYRTTAMREKWVSAILLGAGESKRMGEDKLMLPWGKKTVFERCLNTLLQSELGEVIVVLRTGSETIEERIKRDPAFKRRRIRVAINRDYQRGMSSSIVRGLKYVHPGSGGILIALGDQPLLKARTINALIHAFGRGEGKIAVPFYNGLRGNPILFDRSYMTDLKKLRGDIGGRRIIESYPDKVVRVRTKSEAVVKDIDSWDEYVRQTTADRRQKVYERS